MGKKSRAQKDTREGWQRRDGERTTQAKEQVSISARKAIVGTFLRSASW